MHIKVHKLIKRSLNITSVNTSEKSDNEQFIKIYLLDCLYIQCEFVKDHTKVVLTDTCIQYSFRETCRICGTTADTFILSRNNATI